MRNRELREGVAVARKYQLGNMSLSSFTGIDLFSGLAELGYPLVTGTFHSTVHNNHKQSDCAKTEYSTRSTYELFVNDSFRCEIEHTVRRSK